MPATISGATPPAQRVADDVRIDIPDDYQVPPNMGDVFESGATQSPLSLEIDQKIRAKAEVLSDEVERALHRMLQRNGSFEDVMACILIYIRKKAQDRYDREALNAPVDQAAKGARDKQLQKMSAEVEQLITDTQHRSKLSAEDKATAVGKIREAWQKASELWQNQIPRMPTPNLQQIADEVRAADQAIAEMTRLFHESASRGSAAH